MSRIKPFMLYFTQEYCERKDGSYVSSSCELWLTILLQIRYNLPCTSLVSDCFVILLNPVILLQAILMSMIQLQATLTSTLHNHQLHCTTTTTSYIGQLYTTNRYIGQHCTTGQIHHSMVMPIFYKKSKHAIIYPHSHQCNRSLLFDTLIWC